MPHAKFARLSPLRWSCLVGLLMASLVIGGCHPKAEKSTGTSDPQTTKAASNPQPTAQESKCQDWVESIYDHLRPQNLGGTSDLDFAVVLLNNWRTGCAPEPPPRSSEDDERLAKLLPAEVVGRIDQPEFGRRDGSHIRDAGLFKQITEFAVGKADTDLDRVTNLFDYTVRNVTLWPPGAPRLPLSPFEVLLIGRGTPEDRAWIFVNLLRQLRIDAVILRAYEEKPVPNAWLVGVLLDDQVYLFDTRLGLPIPSDKSGSVLTGTPATLAQVRAQPELIDQFAAGTDQPYPLTSADIKRLRPNLVGTTTLWARRMGLFQEALTGKKSMVVYDGLLRNAGRQGQIERAAAGDPEWKPNDVGLWAYPELQLNGYEQMPAEYQQAVASLLLPFRLEVPALKLKRDREDLKKEEREQQVEMTRSQTTQFRARTDQLLGEFESATARFLDLRLRGTLPPDVAQRVPQGDQLQTRAAAEDDAHYWGGVIKYEQGDYARAAEILRNYLNKSKIGSWSFAARHLLAVSLAKSGQLADAVKVLESRMSNDPYQQANQILARRWQMLEKSSDGSK